MIKKLPPITPLIQKIDKLIEEAHKTQEKADRAIEEQKQRADPFRKKMEQK